jgi:hypothetical protein
MVLNLGNMEGGVPVMKTLTRSLYKGSEENNFVTEAEHGPFKSTLF